MISNLIDYASQFMFSERSFVFQKKECNIFITNEKGEKIDIVNLIIKISHNADRNLSLANKRKIKLALNLIESHLIKNSSSFFSKVQMSKKERMLYRSLLYFIRNAKNKFKNVDLQTKPQSEEEARLKFYQEAAKNLQIKDAATNQERAAIKIISKKIWENDKDHYVERMTQIFQGEHVLIEEKNNNQKEPSFKTFEELERSGKAVPRISSHYDRGKENQQLAISGPQVHTILFGKVTLAEDNCQLIFGKTKKQIERHKGEEEKKALKERHFTWLQLENSEHGYIWQSCFWKHAADFIIYVTLRFILNAEKANVGPYGYGRTDANPTVISKQEKLPQRDS